MDVRDLLKFVYKSGGSDLHISSDEQPMLRIHGEMKRLNHPAINRDECYRMIAGIMDANSVKNTKRT